MTATVSVPAPAVSRVLRHAGYETKVIVTNAEQLLVSLILPVLALFALTFTTVLDGVADSRIDAAAPGVLALTLVSVGFTGQGIQTGFERQYGVLRALATTPLGRSGLILGKITAVGAVAVAHMLILGAVSFMMGWAPVPAYGWALVYAALGIVTFTALGLLIAGTLRAQATLAITNIAWVILASLGGLLMPLTRLPDVLAGFVKLLPSAALGEGLRSSFLSGDVDVTALVVLLVWAAVTVGCALRFFKWDN